MKVIFLDHDGVICLADNWGGRSKKWAQYRSANPESSRDMGQAPVEYRFDNFDQKAIKVLNEILEETGAEIVVSSDLKNYPFTNPMLILTSLVVKNLFDKFLYVYLLKQIYLYKIPMYL